MFALSGDTSQGDQSSGGDGTNPKEEAEHLQTPHGGRHQPHASLTPQSDAQVAPPLPHCHN